jgi:lipid-binding SYLF domain-containing protein
MKTSGMFVRKFVLALLAAGLCALWGLTALHADAASAKKLDSQVQASLADFKSDVKGSNEVLRKAKGILIFPHVYQGGIVVGGKYGEGALLINDTIVDYYNIVSGSYGFQLGAQRKTIIMAFMTDEALQKFQQSSGWTVGADASVALVTIGAEGRIDASTLNKPILAFVVDQKGLMYNLSLEGSKITKIKK